MSETLTLRERQAPLKARYESDPESAKLTITVRSTTTGDDPTRCQIGCEAAGSSSRTMAAPLWSLTCPGAELEDDRPPAWSHTAWSLEFSPPLLRPTWRGTSLF